RRIADGTGESLYLRLSTRPIEQALRGGAVERRAVLEGGYRLVDRGRPDVTLWATGVMVPEAVEAGGLLEADGIRANVFAITRPARATRLTGGRAAGSTGARRVSPPPRRSSSRSTAPRR